MTEFRSAGVTILPPVQLLGSLTGAEPFPTEYRGSKMKANVDANLFRLVNTVTSKDDLRRYISGVFIEPHPEAGAVMVATDGHRMLVAHDADGSCDGSVIVKLPQFALAQCKPPTMFGAKRALEISAGDGSLSSAKIIAVTPAKSKGDLPESADVMTAFAIHVDATYPDWRKVIPQTSGETSGTLSYNGKYIRDIAALSIDIAKHFGVNGCFLIEQTDPGSPAIIRWEGMDNLFGVLMPMRFNYKYAKLPEFMNQTVAQAAE